jgi:hypothetical protein
VPQALGLVALYVCVLLTCAEARVSPEPGSLFTCVLEGYRQAGCWHCSPAVGAQPWVVCKASVGADMALGWVAENCDPHNAWCRLLG